MFKIAGDESGGAGGFSGDQIVKRLVFGVGKLGVWWNRLYFDTILADFEKNFFDKGFVKFEFGIMKNLNIFINDLLRIEWDFCAIGGIVVDLLGGGVGMFGELGRDYDISIQNDKVIY